jgi:FlaG/FlaF family flagellin (archaellin)
VRDRGVSEVIAFILIFSIVITSVGLLYTAGFGSLTQIQESETDRSAERAFGASAIALEDIQRGRGSYRAFDVELSGRMISVNDAASLEVNVGGSNVANATGALVYGRGADTEIAYQSGAVIRSDGPDAQIVSREPLFQCSSERVVLSLVSVEGPPSGAVSSDGSVQIVADGPEPDQSTLVAVRTGGPTPIEVEYGGTPYATAWESYFSDQGWSSVTSSSAECTAQDVYVRHLTIDVDYRGV